MNEVKDIKKELEFTLNVLRQDFNKLVFDVTNFKILLNSFCERYNIK